MDEDNETGFIDKTGKSILIGDVLQLRLASGNKTGGPTRRRVIRFGKHIHLVGADKDDNKYGGYKLTDRIARRAVIVRR